MSELQADPATDTYTLALMIGRDEFRLPRKTFIRVTKEEWARAVRSNDNAELLSMLAVALKHLQKPIWTAG